VASETAKPIPVYPRESVEIRGLLRQLVAREKEEAQLEAGRVLGIGAVNALCSMLDAHFLRMVHSSRWPGWCAHRLRSIGNSVLLFPKPERRLVRLDMKS